MYILSHFFDCLNYGYSVAEPKNNGFLRKKNIKGVACNVGVVLERKRCIILRCCHLGRGSARWLERVKRDPKGEDGWLRNCLALAHEKRLHCRLPKG